MAGRRWQGGGRDGWLGGGADRIYNLLMENLKFKIYNSYLLGLLLLSHWLLLLLLLDQGS